LAGEAFPIDGGRRNGVRRTYPITAFFDFALVAAGAFLF